MNVEKAENVNVNELHIEFHCKEYKSIDISFKKGECWWSYQIDNVDNVRVCNNNTDSNPLFYHRNRKDFDDIRINVLENKAVEVIRANQMKNYSFSTKLIKSFSMIMNVKLKE